MIEQPEEFKLYTIQYQKKEYKVIAEVLFGLYLSQIRNKIEKEWIIDEIIVTIPNDNYLINKRLQLSLESIGMNNITISSYNNYLEQGEILNEILDKNEEYQKYKRILEKDNATETLLNSMPMNEERFNELSKQFDDIGNA